MRSRATQQTLLMCSAFVSRSRAAFSGRGYKLRTKIHPSPKTTHGVLDSPGYTAVNRCLINFSVCEVRAHLWCVRRCCLVDSISYLTQQKSS